MGGRGRCASSSPPLTVGSATGILWTMKCITVECPDKLHEQLLTFVRSGWAHSPEEAVIEALRRFLDSHRPELQEAHVLKDIEWVLKGKE